MKRAAAAGLVSSLLLVWVPRVTGVNLYTQADPPPPPSLDDLPLQATLSQHGITWTFSSPARVGRFVNGDYYVIGPVTVVAIDPPPANGRNGSVLNLPPVVDRSGFDSRVTANRYDPALRADPPISLEPGDSLLSSISVETIGTLKRVLRTSDDTLSPVRSVSVLTCLDAPAPPDAFRPSYCDTSNAIYLSRNLRRELLPRLPPVSRTPSLSEFEGYFQRPWIDTLFFNFDAPIEYMPDYAREIARAVSMAGLLLMLDFPPEEKEALLVYLVQYGIDLYGAVQAGHRGWPAHGGHGSGRKLPIVLAGLLLGDTGMQQPGALFGEDMQTLHAQGWTGATAVYAGHYGPGGSGRYGPYEHLQPAEWPGTLGEDYRRCCTSISWVGEALTMRLMHGEGAWDHPAFFDYVDRWMTEEDAEHVDIIEQQIGVSYHANYLRQGQAWDAFVGNMWAAYRQLSDPAITRQPEDQVVREGDTATFVIEADGTPPLTYLWQKDGSPVAGATNAMHTLPAATPADGGSVFRCLVAGAYGSVTSESATLTVLPAGDGSAEYFWFEAEHSVLTAPAAAGADPDASLGGFGYSTESGSGAIELTFTSAGGSYRVWARAKAGQSDNPDASNSFYVSLDGGAEDTWDLFYDRPGGPATHWEWDRVSTRCGGSWDQNLCDPAVLSLNPGSHTLRFRGRESDTWLDQVLITSDPAYDLSGTGATPDIDLDGLPDAWESAVFGGPDESSAGPTEDSDADGVSDAAEYVGGTDPRDPSSHHALNILFLGGMLSVSFDAPAASGVGYYGRQRYFALECKTGEAWEAVPGQAQVQGSGQRVVHQDAAGHVTDAAQFRVCAWLGE